MVQTHTQSQDGTRTSRVTSISCATLPQVYEVLLSVLKPTAVPFLAAVANCILFAPFH